MTTLLSGDFVWCNFPFGDSLVARARPGPAPHIGYCIASERGGAMLAYTSSGPWRGTGTRLPRGVLDFGTEDAAALNQKPFHLDLRCLAFIPFEPTWFPFWARPDHGVVARAEKQLRRHVEDEALALMKLSPQIVEVRGLPRR